jgi:uncharacterized damage-inducible protein DinB
MERTPWIQRKFNLDLPPGWIYNVADRLAGTPARIASMVKDIHDSKLSEKQAGQWSAKEHIGHLIDLEELHQQRIKDFIDRRDTLSAADMQNKKTYAAGHNSQDLSLLMRYFEAGRKHFVKSLLSLDDETLEFSAMHPRLQCPMRPADMAFFVAEHDDHHLATMRIILKRDF